MTSPSAGPPLPTPGQRVSGIEFPREYRLPAKPDATEPDSVQDAYRQSQFVLGNDLGAFAEGMTLQLGILHDSSHSRYRTHVYAAVVSAWSRAYAALADACTLVTRGAYASAPNLVRSACELIAAEYQLHREEMGEYVGWLLGHLKPDETMKAFDVGLGHYFAGSTLASDDRLRLVYRTASDLGRPNFGATLVFAGPESNNARLAYALDDRSFHMALAEIELGWLIGLCERQVAVAVHMSDVFNIAPETHAAYADYSTRTDALLANPNRARIEEMEQNNFKRWLIHNFRRQPSGAPKKLLL